MDQSPPKALRHCVVVPLDGQTVGGARARAEALGLDPDSPHARLVGALEYVEPDWEVAVTFEVGSDGAVPVGVEVRSLRGEALTRAVWDRVRPANVIREARDSVAWFHPELAAEFTDPGTAFRRGRPPEYPDEFYRRVGQVYMTALAEHESPVRTVARAWEGKPHPGRPSEILTGLLSTTDKRARAWVRAARARGYITDSTHMKGGEK